MLQWKFFSLSKTLPTTQISAAIQNMSDLCELTIDMFLLTFWYQVHFAHLLAANFSKADFVFILFDLELSFKKQRNEIHQYKINE